MSALTPEARARRIKVILFDVDGVLTDGQLFILPNSDGSGTELKGFSSHDGLGISLARLDGMKVGIITKRQSQTVAIRARDLRLEFVYQGQSNKMNAIHDIVTRTGASYEEIAYVGDDIVDLPVMRVVGLAIAPANARPQINAAAHYVTPNSGGHGAGRDAVEFILNARGTLDKMIEAYISGEHPLGVNDIGQGNM